MINDSIPLNVSGGDHFAAVQAGMGVWANIPGADVSIFYGGSTPLADASAIDGVNLITFTDGDLGDGEESVPFPFDVLALTPTTSFTEPTLFNGRWVRPGQIVDADILFNPNVTFGADGGAGVDIESVMAHEAGHFFGLAHSAVETSTMFPVLRPGTLASSLETEDSLAMLKAYPSEATLATASRIGGTVTSGFTSAPVAGAAVFAIDTSSVHRDTLGCEFTLDTDGSYEFLGLPAGDYYIAIHPLNGSQAIHQIKPGVINERLGDTADTTFVAEYFNDPDGNAEDPDAKTVVSVTPGLVSNSINLTTNRVLDALAVDQSYPESDATDVRVDAPILVSFNQPMDLS
ncbi:MAG: matrixin family metalloprotease, partial [bacterium]